MSYLSTSVYFVRTTSVIVCTHTHLSIDVCIYIYIHIGLASSNVSRRIRLEPVHTHTLTQPVSFSIRLRCLDVTREKWATVEMREHHWCERNSPFFMQYFIVASSILSRNDSRLIKLVQSVNLIRRFPSYSISFYTHTLTLAHTYYPLCFDKLVCVLYH